MWKLYKTFWHSWVYIVYITRAIRWTNDWPENVTFCNVSSDCLPRPVGSFREVLWRRLVMKRQLCNQLKGTLFIYKQRVTRSIQPCNKLCQNCKFRHRCFLFKFVTKLYSNCSFIHKGLLYQTVSKLFINIKKVTFQPCHKVVSKLFVYTQGSLFKICK